MTLVMLYLQQAFGECKPVSKHAIDDYQQLSAQRDCQFEQTSRAIFLLPKISCAKAR